MQELEYRVPNEFQHCFWCKCYSSEKIPTLPSDGRICLHQRMGRILVGAQFHIGSWKAGPNAQKLQFQLLPLETADLVRSLGAGPKTLMCSAVGMGLGKQSIYNKCLRMDRQISE